MKPYAPFEIHILFATVYLLEPRSPDMNYGMRSMYRCGMDQVPFVALQFKGFTMFYPADGMRSMYRYRQKVVCTFIKLSGQS